MTEKTWLIGKDAALEDSIERMLSRLAELGFEPEEVNWLNPVPHVWSVHIRDRHCPMLFTNGKGASRKAALASALGEFVERLATDYFFSDYFLGYAATGGAFVHAPDERWFTFAPDDEHLPDGLFDPCCRATYDPEGRLRPAHLVDLNTADPDRGIVALPFRRLNDDQQVWLPVNVLANLYASNGMAAGNTPAEARTQALSEILERYVKNLVIAEGISLPAIPPAVLDRYPQVKRAIAALESAGFELRLCDASLAGHFPVINVTLFDPRNGGVFASFGAHPRFEVALERTVTELLQGRDLDALDGFQPPLADLEAVADPHNLETHFIDSSGRLAWAMFRDEPDFPFVDWDFGGPTDREFETLCRQLESRGGQVYIRDYLHLGLYACRIVVPGFSEVYPVDDLVEFNSNRGVSLFGPLLNLTDLDTAGCNDLAESLDDMGLDEYERPAELLGLACNPGSAWASLRIGELKAWLALSISDFEQALHWIGWTLAVGGLAPPRRRLLQALQARLELDLHPDLDPDDFCLTLPALFGPKTIREVDQILAGELRFPGLESPTRALKALPKHAALLAAWSKVQAAKATAARVTTGSQAGTSRA
ncbi:MAG: 30S ribosomal protein S12 methylthiotransferase accessory factor YcaO [Halothiobacillaceae bacterium]